MYYLAAVEISTQEAPRKHPGSTQEAPIIILTAQGRKLVHGKILHTCTNMALWVHNHTYLTGAYIMGGQSGQ